MGRRDTSTSRYLSLVLRHAHARAGITLDAEGWVGVDDLLAGAARNGKPMSRGELEDLVATNDKKRFKFDLSGKRIRAAQGHSVLVSLGHAPVAPPATLLHGTHPRAVDAIQREGLLPMSRQQVHLSADHQTARTVGARRGAPVVLTIDAAAMARDGHQFWQSTNGVWLCNAVPPGYITFP